MNQIYAERIEIMESEQRRLKDEIAQGHNSQFKLTQESKSRQEELRQLEKSLGEKNSIVAQLKIDEAEILEKVVALQSEVDMLKVTLENRDSEILQVSKGQNDSKNEHEVAELEMKNNNLQEQNSNLKQLSEEMKLLVSSLNLRIQELERDNSIANQQVHSLRNSGMSSSSQKNSLEIKESRIRLLEDIVEEKQAEINLTKERLQHEKESIVTSLQNIIRQQDEIIKESKSQQKLLLDSVEQQKLEIQVLSDNIEDLRNQNLNDEETYKDELGYLKQLNGEMSEELAQERQKVDHLESEILAMKKTIMMSSKTSNRPAEIQNHTHGSKFMLQDSVVDNSHDHQIFDGFSSPGKRLPDEKTRDSEAPRFSMQFGNESPVLYNDDTVKKGLNPQNTGANNLLNLLQTPGLSKNTQIESLDPDSVDAESRVEEQEDDSRYQLLEGHILRFNQSNSDLEQLISKLQDRIAKLQSNHPNEQEIVRESIQLGYIVDDAILNKLQADESRYKSISFQGYQTH